MIYFINAYAIESKGNTYSYNNSKENTVMEGLMIESQSTKEAMEHAKEIVSDIYDGDVMVEVITEEKFKVPMYKGKLQEDDFIILHCERLNGKWRYSA